MDRNEKDVFSEEKSTVNYDDSVNNNPPADWQISGSNSVHSYPPENLISASSCSPSQMIDSFGQTLWYDPANVQGVGYGGFNAPPSCSFRGNIEMGWNLPNMVLPKANNSLFLPNASSFLPAQFPADSGFIERAARFSLFSDMVNQPPLGNPESIGLFPSNELNVGEAHNDASTVPNVRSSEQAKLNFPGSGNVSEDTTQSSGGNGQRGGETSSKCFDSKKRKRNRQVSEADRSQRSEGEPDKNGDQKQSPNSGGKQTSDPPKDGYIHVRARRGQATNSHSLAERVRREKISERMKFLQDLVPGCNKVTGKAVMLDEIINYVQSLQRQVEFLSMKLATVNPQMDFNLEGLLAKDALQQRASSSSAIPFPQNMSMVYPPLPHGFMQQTLINIGRTVNTGFKRQETNGWEDDDLQNVININYGAGDPDPQAAAATASLAAANMKVEP